MRSRFSDPVSTWQHVIQYYTRLHLSYETDRLPAQAAIVDRTTVPRKNAQYIAGMWTDSLIEDLAWYGVEVTSSQSSRAKLGKLPRPRNEAYVPSWSWASTQGRVELEEFKPRANLLVGLTYTPNGPTSLGGVLYAPLHLKGPVFVTSITKLTEDYYHPASSHFGGMNMSLNMPDSYYSSDRFKRPTVPITVLIIGKLEWVTRLVGLVLYKSGDDWERIGLTFIDCQSDGNNDSQRLQDFSASLPVEEVTII